VTGRDWFERLDLLGRLRALVDELERLDADDVDVPLTIAVGLLEELEAELEGGGGRP
jgi:hypothetical protein